MIQWIRSLLFFIALNVVGIIFIPFMILISFFISERHYYLVVRQWCKLIMFLLRIIVGVRYKITGIENLAKLKNRPAIIISNHQSTFETFFFPTVLHDYCFVLKRELLSIPIFGQGLRRLNPIAIDREEGKQAFKMMIESAQKRFNNNISIIIFPEGTRTSPDENNPYKKGAFLLASKLKAPVLPISVNSGCAWPKGQLMKHKGTIEIIIGEFIESEGKGTQALLDETQAWIEAHKKTILAP